MTTKQKLAAIVRYYTGQGLMLPAIATHIGVPYRTLHAWHAGDRDPDTMADSVRKIDKAWGEIP